MRLKALAFSGVNDVRAGRLIEIDHEPGISQPAQLEDMCRKLLANMVIENFEIEQKG
jgi:phosphoribosylformylglycinamidine synthase PurS subunit